MEPTFVICSVYHNVWTALDVHLFPSPSPPSVFNFLCGARWHWSLFKRKNFEMTISSYDIKISFEWNFIENTQRYTVGSNVNSFWNTHTNFVFYSFYFEIRAKISFKLIIFTNDFAVSFFLSFFLYIKNYHLLHTACNLYTKQTNLP